MSVVRQCISEDNILSILPLQQHGALAHRPRLIVEVLAVEHGVGLAVQASDVFLCHRQHASGPAGRVVNGLYDMALGQILLVGEQEVNHQLDDLTGREVVPRLLVAFLRSDADELLEDVAHLHVVHAGRAQVDLLEGFDDQEEDVLLGHLHHLIAELELLQDLPHVRAERVDVAVQVHREVVRVGQQVGEGQLAGVVELDPTYPREHGELDVLALALHLDELLQHGLLGGLQHRIEAP